MPRSRSALTPARRQYCASLALALDAGFAILEHGGSSLDAVTTCVRMLEDDPLFNAGRGAALTRDGQAELDAAVMSGTQQKAGAVAAVRHVKNPVELARRVMEKSRHVLLVGAGAEEFALEEGFHAGTLIFTSAPTSGAGSCAGAAGNQRFGPDAGAAWHGRRRRARRHGDLAAATSTGGMTNKRAGRVGDSPIIGAGTYAKNGVCAVSATGHGEYFIRAVAAYHICCAVEYRGLTLAQAAREASIRTSARSAAAAASSRSMRRGTSSWNSARRPCFAPRAMRTAGARSQSSASRYEKNEVRGGSGKAPCRHLT